MGGFSDEARRSAALARKIKSRLGVAAYKEYKRTGRVPPGLDAAKATPRRGKRSGPLPTYPKHTPPLRLPPPKKPEQKAESSRLKSPLDSFSLVSSHPVMEDAKRGMREMSKVIDLPFGLPRIPVKAGRGEKTVGGYYRAINRTTGEYSPKQITVSPKSEYSTLTFLHEAGHFVDDRGIDPGISGLELMASEARTASMQVWEDAVKESEAFKTLSSMKTTPSRYQVSILDISSGRERNVGPDQKFVRYLQKPRELFARSFAQYIATKSEDTKLKKELLRKIHERPSSIPYPYQWEEEDFKDIAAAFDLMFEELGWLKS